jgi:hypothetical protein
MKLDKDSFLMNMNMVELDGKKVLVRPSQAESTKGKDVIIREEWPPSMIKPKSLKAGQWPKNEGGGRTGIKGHENWIIRNTKPDSPVSLGQASTSTAGSSSSK